MLILHVSIRHHIFCVYRNAILISLEILKRKSIHKFLDFCFCWLKSFAVSDWRGATFQTLFPSFRNVAWDKVVLPLLSRSLPLKDDLEHCVFGSFVGIVKLRGEPLMLIAFHTSVSLIWAFILFTDSIFTFDINVSVFTLSSGILSFYFGLIGLHEDLGVDFQS